MKIVKALVILMGVLIVLGMGLLVYGFVMRVGKAPTTDPAQDSAPLVPLGGSVTGFGDVAVSLDDGEILLDMQTEASRLLLRTKTADGTDIIRVFDLSTGKALGRFVVGK
ncbi:hypothetical protein EOI86_24075 [Hwanghaeella grinnelliae]|uniref:Fimbrial protein n=1 Tax=Hwanghaeella grinnelliae TaxID=2500179 RepID=A0A437QI23_9PROT|nr:hypothetical protein [Hwanghaeella grinnelliae]RVU34191.1 hypothetical protein EOI86_24075 [Hwanghaeella grinnelliae]